MSAGRKADLLYCLQADDDKSFFQFAIQRFCITNFLHFSMHVCFLMPQKLFSVCIIFNFSVNIFFYRKGDDFSVILLFFSGFFVFITFIPSYFSSSFWLLVLRRGGFLIVFPSFFFCGFVLPLSHVPTPNFQSYYRCHGQLPTHSRFADNYFIGKEQDA